MSDERFHSLGHHEKPEQQFPAQFLNTVVATPNLSDEVQIEVMKVCILIQDILRKCFFFVFDFFHIFKSILMASDAIFIACSENFSSKFNCPMIENFVIVNPVL